MFKARNGRVKIAQAAKSIKRWKPDKKATTSEQYDDFIYRCTKYKKELGFGLKWGLKEHEINRLDEAVLFDMFMDRASASDKLWTIFDEKVSGRRTLRKACLLSKHMTFLERARTTQKRKSKKKKTGRKESINAIKKQWCHFHKTDSHPWKDCNSNPRNRRKEKNRFGKDRYGKRRNTEFKKRNFNKSWRNRKNREPHNPGKNCETWGHTPETCWTLHPNLKPKGKRRGKIFAMQREMNKIQEQLDTAIDKWIIPEGSKEEKQEQQDSESESTEEPQMEYTEQERTSSEEEEHISNSSEEEEGSEEDTESESPISFKYRRPRQE